MSITASDNRRILVIDDNVEIHEDYRKVLAQANASSALDQARASLFGEAPKSAQDESFAVDFSEQGEAGLRLVEQAVGLRKPYALAFVDMRMPLADDSTPNQMLVVQLLERRGCRVDVVTGGSEALVALAQQHYDLLFLDCFMPDMNEFETARRIRSCEPSGRRMPIIALNANVLPEDRQK